MSLTRLIAAVLSLSVVGGCGPASAQSQGQLRDQIYQHQLNYMNLEQQALEAQAKHKQERTEKDAVTYGRAVAFGCRAQSESVNGYEARRDVVYNNCLLAHEPLKARGGKQ